MSRAKQMKANERRWSQQWPVAGWDRHAPVAYVCGCVLLVGAVLVAAVVSELHRMQQESRYPPTDGGRLETAGRPPRLWVAGSNVDSGYLKHVLNVFNRLGYQRSSEEDFDLLWSHPYPFKTYNDTLMALKANQMVNHFPGSGYITSKVELSTSGIKHIPTAFKMPKEKEQLLQYAEANPGVLFVKKSNTHRDIKIASLSEADLESNATFFQEYIANPLLVDGHKFDIGVYTVMTSLDPLRVYVYWGDVLIRFCAEKYHPFDPTVLDKYVVGDSYLPVWKVPSLAHYHTTLKLGHRESLNAFLQSQGRQPQQMWRQIEESIRSVYWVKEAAMLRSTQRFRRGARQFFELVRFDFVVDDRLDVYLMEANMSPNLSSAHFKQNVMLYEQVVYSLLCLIGAASRLTSDLNQLQTGPVAEMQAADRDLAVFGLECGSSACLGSCSGICRVCLPCLSKPQKAVLRQALLEHLNRHLTRRILPAATTREQAKAGHHGLQNMTASNQLMHLWFRGKCLLDSAFC